MTDGADKLRDLFGSIFGPGVLDGFGSGADALKRACSAPGRPQTSPQAKDGAAVASEIERAIAALRAPGR
jgi:hypothetical protein